MDEEDKKNMMIKEILEVFPEKRKESLDKAIDMKKKIDLFAELFLPDDLGEGGFSLSSLVNINNLVILSCPSPTSHKPHNAPFRRTYPPPPLSQPYTSASS